MDFSGFWDNFKGLLSQDKGIRLAAFQRLEIYLKDAPDETVRILLRALTTAEDQEVLLQCMLLLKLVCKSSKVSKASGESQFARLKHETKEELKTQLLVLLLVNSEDVIRRNLCELAYEITKKMPEPLTAWPELRSVVVEMMNSPTPHHQRSCLQLLGRLCEHFEEDLCNDGGLMKVLKMYMASPDMWVKAECVSFIGDVLAHGWYDAFVNSEDLGQQIIVSLEAACYEKHPCSKDFIESIIRIAELHLDIFKEYIPPLSILMWNFASNEQLEDAVRRSAVEILLCIAEYRPLTAIAVPDFVKNTCEALFRLMLNITEENAEQWMIEQGSSGDNYISDTFVEGEEGLDRLAKAFEELDGSVVLNEIWKFIQQSQSINDWRYQLVGIMAISQTTEYISEAEVPATLEAIIPYLLLQLKAKDPKMRFAACHAIAQLATDHQPYVQQNYYNQLLPEIVNAMNDSNDNVKANATATFISYCEEISKPILLPYADFLMEKFITEITQPGVMRFLQEQAMSALAVLAGVIKKHFLKYYDTVMPALLGVVCKGGEEENKVLRGRAMECVSIIGLSVGPEYFQAYGGLIMNELIKIRTESFADDDLLEDYLDQAFSRMCSAMQSGFTQFLPEIIPRVLGVMREQVDDADWEDDSDTDDEDAEDGQSKSYVERCQMLATQWKAIDLIDTYAEVLQENFREYFEDCASALLLMLSRHPPSYTEKKILMGLVSLISAVKAAVDKGVWENRDFLVMLTTNVTNNILSSFDSGTLRDDIMQEEDDTMSYIALLNDTILKAGPSVLYIDVIKNIAESVFALLTESAVYIKEKTANIEETTDADLRNESEKQLQQEEVIRSLLVELLGSIMSAYPQEFTREALKNTLEIANEYLSEGKPKGDRLIALYICDDLFENLKGGDGIWKNYLSELVKSATDEDTSIRQAACYAIGKAAHISGFEEVVERVIPSISAAISMKTVTAGQTQRGVEIATDTAVAALGYCLCMHFNSISNAGQLLQVWLQHLPLKQDEAEAKLVHTDLMKLVEQKDPNTLGPSGENLAKIVSVFSNIYESPFSTDELNVRIMNFMKEVGEEKLDSFAHLLTEVEKKTVPIIFVDASMQ